MAVHALQKQTHRQCGRMAQVSSPRSEAKSLHVEISPQQNQQATQDRASIGPSPQHLPHFQIS